MGSSTTVEERGCCLHTDCPGREWAGWEHVSTLWEQTADTKMTQKFTTGGARQLMYPAPLHHGTQPQGEPAVSGQPAAASGGSAKQEDQNTPWIPAHEVYNDTENIPARQQYASDLQFESRFESGNLASAVCVTEFEYNFFLRPDRGSGGCQWYYFSVSNMEKGPCYRFNIAHFYKEKSMYHHGLRPLLWSQNDSKSKSQLGWRRAGAAINYFANGVKRKNGGRQFTLSFEITFDHDDDVCFLAMCYPFTYSDLCKTLLQTQQLTATSRIMTRTELCKTEGGNSCEMLTICGYRACSQPERRPVFFFSGRVHPGESNSSYIVNGLIQFLVSNHEIACALRQHFVFEIIPMLNADGVIHGHYRTSLSGDDLNRNWSEAQRERHATIYHAKRRLKALAGEGRLLFFCDIHGHSTKKNVFMYGCNSNALGSSLFGTTDSSLQTKGVRREQLFPKLFSERCPVFSFHDCRYEIERKKENTGRAAVGRECNILHSFTLEASLCGYDLGAESSEPCLTHFTTSDLEMVGAQLAKSLAAYCADESQQHGWNLPQQVPASMRQALHSDEPLPGARVLDIYYQQLKKHETEKAQEQIDMPLSTVVANVMGAGTQRHDGSNTRTHTIVAHAMGAGAKRHDESKTYPHTHIHSHTHTLALTLPHTHKDKCASTVRLFPGNAPVRKIARSLSDPNLLGASSSFSTDAADDKEETDGRKQSGEDDIMSHSHRKHYPSGNNFMFHADAASPEPRERPLATSRATPFPLPRPSFCVRPAKTKMTVEQALSAVFGLAPAHMHEQGQGARACAPDSKEQTQSTSMAKALHLDPCEPLQDRQHSDEAVQAAAECDSGSDGISHMLFMTRPERRKQQQSEPAMRLMSAKLFGAVSAGVSAGDTWSQVPSKRDKLVCALEAHSEAHLSHVRTLGVEGTKNNETKDNLQPMPTRRKKKTTVRLEGRMQRFSSKARSIDFSRDGIATPNRSPHRSPQVIP